VVSGPDLTNQVRKLLPIHQLVVAVDFPVLVNYLLAWQNLALTDKFEQFLPLLTLFFDLKIVILNQFVVFSKL